MCFPPFSLVDVLVHWTSASSKFPPPLSFSFFFFFFFFWFLALPTLKCTFRRLAAIGCASVVRIVDVETLETVQTLDNHPASVCVCKWANRPLDTKLDNEYKLQLASGDVKGNVMIWSVVEGVAELHLTDSPQSPVLELQWHPKQHNLLLTLRSPNIIALWDCQKGQVIWRKAFPKADDLFCAAFNPFPTSLPLFDVLFATRRGWIFNMPDLLESPDASLKYKIASPEQKSSFNGMTFAEAHPGCILFMLSRELLIFDTKTQHPVGGFSLDRGMADLVTGQLIFNLLFFGLYLLFSLVSCSYTKSDVLWSLHEDGRMAVWKSKPESPLSFYYVAASNPPRFGKTRRRDAQAIVAMKVKNNGTNAICLDKTGTILEMEFSEADAENGVPAQVNCVQLRSSLPASCASFAVHPSRGLHRLAVGTKSGTLCIVDMSKRSIVREFVIDAGQPVLGVRWFDEKTVFLFVVQEVQMDSVWCNSVLKVDINTGRIISLINTKRAEPTFIRDIQVSPSMRYMLVLRKDRPLELWNIQNGAVHLGNVKPYIQITSIVWKEGGKDLQQEEFAAATSDNMLRIFRVSDGHLSVVRQQESVTLSPIVAMHWKEDQLAAGDSAGGLTCFDWSRKVCYTINTKGNGVKKLAWAPGKSMLILVCSASGSVSLYDMANKKMVRESVLLSARSIKVHEMLWATKDSTLIASNDGCIRLVDASLSSCNSHLNMSRDHASSHVCTPYVLECREALVLKVSLQTGAELARESGMDPLLSVPSAFLNDVAASEVGVRNLKIAKYFGDRYAENIWNLILNSKEEQDKEKESNGGVAMVPTENNNNDANNGNKISEEDEVSERQMIVSTDENKAEGMVEKEGEDELEEAVDPNSVGAIVNDVANISLPYYYGALRSREEVRQQHAAQTIALEQRRNVGDSNSFHVVADRYILIGDKHNAVRTLTGAETSWPSHQNDSLLACVVAAASGKEDFTRTTCMVATNLIAKGDIDLGTQLLVLVNRSFDACRYLLDAGRYDDAVTLAKLSLNAQQCREIMKQWVDHLVAVNDDRAAMVLISLRCYHELLSYLHRQERFELAVELYQYLLETKQLDQPVDEAAKVGFEHVVQSLHLDQGFFLHRLGLENQSVLAFGLAGGAGLQMIEAVSGAPEHLRDRSGSRGQTVKAVTPTVVKGEQKKKIFQSLRNEIADLVTPTKTSPTK